MSNLVLPDIKRGMDVEQLTEAVALMRKELDWLLNGNLDVKNISAERIQVSAANVTGKLTASQIDATHLQVSAANITGQLTANQIDATNLRVQAANITGQLTASQINTNGLQADSVRSSWVYSNVIQAGQIVAGTLTGFTIQTALAGDRIRLTGNSLDMLLDDTRHGISLNGSSKAVEFYYSNQLLGSLYRSNSTIFLSSQYSLSLNTGSSYNLSIPGDTIFSGNVIFNKPINQAYVDGLFTSLADKANLSYLDSNFFYGVAFDPGSRNLKFYNRNGMEIRSVTIP